MREKERITYTSEEGVSIPLKGLTQKHWAVLSALMSKKGHLLKARQIQYYISHGSYGLNKGENGDGSKVIIYLRELKDHDFLESNNRCRGDDWFLTEEGEEYINNWFEKLTLSPSKSKNLMEEILLVLDTKGRTTKISISELKNILTSKRGTPSSPREPLDLPSKEKFKSIIFSLNLKDLIEVETKENSEFDEILIGILWKGKAITQAFKEER